MLIPHWCTPVQTVLVDWDCLGKKPSQKIKIKNNIYE